jgi:exosortase
MQLRFLDEQLPAGVAGSIRDAAGGQTDGLLLILPASLVCPPSIDVLVSAHVEGQSELTMMFNPACGNGQRISEATGIFVCESSVLEHIPAQGYFDIKEGLIPEMVRVGKTIHAARLPSHAGNFRDRDEYLSAVTDYLEEDSNLDNELKLRKRSDSQVIWTAEDAIIDPTARIYGPVVILDDARICSDAVIFGPTVVGRNVTIGRGTVIINSVLWDGAQVCEDARIRRCVLGCGAIVRDGIVEEESVPFRSEAALKRVLRTTLAVAEHKVSRLREALEPKLAGVSAKLRGQVQAHQANILLWLAGGLLLIAFLWSYWPGIKELWSIWQRSDEYSSSLLVPFLAVYILWSRRQDLSRCRKSPSVWGIFAFLAAQGGRLFGLYFMYSSAERLSIVLSIGALVLLLFGWQLFRKVSTLLLFLCLMLPWPHRVQAAVTLPLQKWATSSAAFCLEMMGYEIVQEGNIINIGNATVAVAEACNGLRMVTAFFIISSLVVLLVRRAWWEKLIILVSSLPIALLCNTIRLAITAVAFTVLDGEQWEKLFHNFGGYAMMPLALAVVVTELWFLAKLTTLPAEQTTI